MTTTTHLPTRAWLLCVGPAARKTLRWKESLFARRAHTRLGSGGLALLPRASLVRSGKFFLFSRCSLARSCHASYVVVLNSWLCGTTTQIAPLNFVAPLPNCVFSLTRFVPPVLLLH